MNFRYFVAGKKNSGGLSPVFMISILIRTFAPQNQRKNGDSSVSFRWSR